MLALRAQITIESVGGSRSVPMRDFLLGMFTTALEPQELLTSIRIPSSGGRTAGDYLKLSRRVGDFAAVGVAVSLTIGERGMLRKKAVIEQAGIALTAVGPTNVAVPEAESALVGNEPSEKLFAQVSDIVAQGTHAHDDARGTAEYKKAIIREYVLRGLTRSAERAA
jgi:carbon-monoxide dehydrogenase medium subunit